MFISRNIFRSNYNNKWPACWIPNSNHFLKVTSHLQLTCYKEVIPERTLKRRRCQSCKTYFLILPNKYLCLKNSFPFFRKLIPKENIFTTFLRCKAHFFPKFFVLSKLCHCLPKFFNIFIFYKNTCFSIFNSFRNASNFTTNRTYMIKCSLKQNNPILQLYQALPIYLCALIFQIFLLNLFLHKI